MPVLVVGANFRSAPLELLERLAIDAERRPKALAGLYDLEHVHEAVVVSTCNRVEVYAAVSRFHGAAGDVRRFLADLRGLTLGEFAHHLYDYYEERAVRHLFAVAAGVDSMVVGEAQILGQVREAFQAAQEVCDRLVAAGVTSILNFAPAHLQVPAGVSLRKVDLSTELQILSFHEQRRAAVDLVRQVAARNRDADTPGPEARD